MWASPRTDVCALALVGSHARGAARPDSDIDLILLVSDPLAWLNDHAWIEQFGAVASIHQEDWGRLQSLRVFYHEGPEVELGIAGADWAATDPVDSGTAEVVAGGLAILVDPFGKLGVLQRAVRAL